MPRVNMVWKCPMQIFSTHICGSCHRITWQYFSCHAVVGILTTITTQLMCHWWQFDYCTLITIFKISREWDPLKITLSIWTPNSHVRLTNTRLYQMYSFHQKNSMLSWGMESFRLSQPKWGQYVSQFRLSRPKWGQHVIQFRLSRPKY